MVGKAGIVEVHCCMALKRKIRHRDADTELLKIPCISFEDAFKKDGLVVCCWLELSSLMIILQGLVF